ncbi:MAG: hypothetical protein E4G91_10965 [Candidatus Zixiibacteriota bacterium]|nr:MAG: hypothetical protein E4G91_10965 [candidate division Zixibacteria bacterium]
MQRLTREPGLIDRLVWTNDELEPIFDWFPIEKTVTIQQNGEVVSSRYNLENQACQLVRLFRKGGSQLGSAGGGVVGKTITNRSVFENSLKLENLHLLA